MSRTSPELRQERTDWLERVESIATRLREHGTESIELRTLAPASVDALSDIGAWAISGPTEVNGLLAHPSTQAEVFAEIARADMSAGWCTMIEAVTAGLVGAHLRDGEPFEAVFGPGFPRVAGTANPEGTAQPCDGGFRINGRWAFASGIRHCNWVLTGVRLLDEHGEPQVSDKGAPLTTAMVLPTGALEIEDSWHVMGLQGTGSSHYRIPDRVFSAEYEMPFGGPNPRRGGPWCDVPTITFLAPGHAGIPLGAAAAALDVIRDTATRVRFGSTTSLGTRPVIQRDFSVAANRLAAARAFALQVFDDAWDQRQLGEPITLAHDARIRSMVAWVTDTCLDVVRFAHHALGGAANFTDHPLQQLLRDLTAASQHIFVSDFAYERDGSFQLAPRGDGS